MRDLNSKGQEVVRKERGRNVQLVRRDGSTRLKETLGTDMHHVDLPDRADQPLVMQTSQVAP